MTERFVEGPSALVSSERIVLGSHAAAACACGHETAGHDRTALRYCQATASNALRRECICTVAQAQPMSRR
jgi:hypothetical protein